MMKKLINIEVLQAVVKKINDDMKNMRKVLVQKADKIHNHKAEEVPFVDGESLQEKFDNGQLKGEKGEQGEMGPQGLQGEAGPQGPKGDQGAPFAIKKVYASVDAMVLDFDNAEVAVNDFVLINTENVEDEDNAKLYVKEEDGFALVTDLSGAQGIQGPQGEMGPQGPAGADGAFDAETVFDVLNTENKTVLGAINELLAMVQGLHPVLPEEIQMYYGFIPHSVTGTISSFNEITLEMIQNENSMMVASNPVSKDQVSLGFVPEGCYMVVAVPALSNLVVTKDNGVGGKVEFNVTEAPGANGLEKTYVVNGEEVVYKLYGELALVSGERFIYID